MTRTRLTSQDRDMRRNSRRLRKVLRHVPAHKQCLGEALVDLATSGTGKDAQRAIEGLMSLVEAAPSPEDARNDSIAQVLRTLDGGNGVSNPPSTPGGRRIGTHGTERDIIYSNLHHPVIDERLPCRPGVLKSKESLVENAYMHFFNHRSLSLAFEIPWNTLAKGEKRKWTTALKGLWETLDGAWPRDLPVREPYVPEGNVVCPACDGNRSVSRSLRVALEWFLARRAKKTKLDGRERIDPGDWGYEEIAAVELCDHYRNMQTPMLAMNLIVGVPNLFQDQKPTRLHPTSIEVRRYPTEKQLYRGDLELKEKYKKMSAVDMSVLKKMKKTGQIRGPSLVDNGKGVFSCDWKGRGVGARVIHIKSGLSSSCESFSNFSQNLSSAEISLELEVAKWFEEASAQKEDLRK